MSHYKTILLAIDLTDEAEQVAKKALTVSDADNSQIHIIHVVEPISFAYGGDIPMDFSTIQRDFGYASVCFGQYKHLPVSFFVQKQRGLLRKMEPPYPKSQ